MIKRALYIDGPNLYEMMKSLGLSIDYAKLYSFFNADGDLLRAYYYTAVDSTTPIIKLRPLLDWMEFNNYTVVQKDVKVQINSRGERRIKGNMDIELCVDAMLMARHTTEVYLFSGDGDFVPLLRALKTLGNRVVVVASTKTPTPMCSSQLRKEADRFIEITELTVFEDGHGEVAGETGGRQQRLDTKGRQR